MQQLTQYHSAEKISEGFFRITEKDVVNIYLFTGRDKALLIDMGCGAGNLSDAIRKLTDKPLICAATHRHPDHVGAAGQFGMYYCDPDDLSAEYDSIGSAQASRGMCERFGLEYNPVSASHCDILTINDATIFDLGDRQIIAEKLPGHTKGSRIFIDHKSKIIVSGDAVNPYMFLQLAGCLSIEEWLKHTDSIVNYLKEGYSSWYGHGDGRQSLEQVEQIIRYGKEIVRRKKEGILPDAGSYPEETLPRVYYRSDNVICAD